MAQHGWKTKPSPRRGFTMVEAARANPPIVMALRKSPHAVRDFRSAAEYAMRRASDLVVLDFGRPALDKKIQEASDVRVRKALARFLASQHIEVLRMGHTDSYLNETLGHSESIRASMLIVGADDLDSEVIELVCRRGLDLLVLRN